MKIVGVIPARYKSSRFPGKPLIDIYGKPMIIRVCEQVSQSSGLDSFCVATDDDRIASACKQYGFDFYMTSESCQTGTDRVAEVSNYISADLYVNIQGDEPLIEPDVITNFIYWVQSRYKKCLLHGIHHTDVEVFNSMAVINDPLDLINTTVPKVVVNDASYAVYLSRSAVPYPKGSSYRFQYYRQLGLYAFTAMALKKFSDMSMGHLESIESIEILRFIENFMPVQMFETKTNSIAVDTPDDLKRVISQFENTR